MTRRPISCRRRTSRRRCDGSEWKFDVRCSRTLEIGWWRGVVLVLVVMVVDLNLGRSRGRLVYLVVVQQNQQ